MRTTDAASNLVDWKLPREVQPYTVAAKKQDDWPTIQSKSRADAQLYKTTSATIFASSHSCDLEWGPGSLRFIYPNAVFNTIYQVSLDQVWT